MRRLGILLFAVAAGTALGLAGGVAYRIGAERGEGTSVATSHPPADEVTPTGVLAIHEAPRPVPEFRFIDGDERPMTLEAFRDRAVLLNIWATWCGPCRKEMPALDGLQATLGGPAFEVVPLSIDRAGLAAVKAFYRELGLTALGIYLDETARAAVQLGAIGLPTTLLIDRQGREIGRLVGPAEWDSPEMLARLQQEFGLPPAAERTRTSEQ